MLHEYLEVIHELNPWTARDIFYALCFSRIALIFCCSSFVIDVICVLGSCKVSYNSAFSFWVIVADKPCEWLKSSVLPSDCLCIVIVFLSLCFIWLKVLFSLNICSKWVIICPFSFCFEIIYSNADWSLVSVDVSVDRFSYSLSVRNWHMMNLWISCLVCSAAWKDLVTCLTQLPSVINSNFYLVCSNCTIWFKKI